MYGQSTTRRSHALRPSIRPGGGGGDRTCDRGVPGDFRAIWLSTGPPTPLKDIEGNRYGAGQWKVHVLWSIEAYSAFVQTDAYCFRPL
ncbi:hypothetical protein PoB_001148900 [Plakobranchus ocellatus]|uniref:Uncharacterized protein n=1 Tax=Plakobranchus ocellatus TaxID=259542 RepID=A0AAV3YSQ2_9GAST|nr:hypothetical protein PoB_001148900 [Plakobranchus ocellatus]